MKPKKLVVFSCWDCPMLNPDRDVCLHPDDKDTAPLSRSVPDTCPLRTEALTITVDDEPDATE